MKHYRHNGSDSSTLPTWRQTPRAVPPPMGSPAPLPRPAPPARPAAPAAGAANGPGTTGGGGPGASTGSPRTASLGHPASPATPLPPQSTAPPAPAAHHHASTWTTPLAPGPAALPLPGRPPRTSGGSRRRGLLASLGLVLALVGGLLAWRFVGHDEPTLNRAPFYLALADLAVEPVAHYSGSAPGGAAAWDLRATAGGEILGTVTLTGQPISVMTVGGRTYLKPPQQMLSDLPSGASISALQGKWVTGDDNLAKALPHGLGSPPELASQLRHALEDTTFPKLGAPPVKVGSESAVAATTPLGTLYVAASAPYRVLRLVPKPGSGAMPSLSTAMYLGPARGAAAVHAVDAAWSRPAALADDSIGRNGLGATDFEQMSPSDVDQVYGDLIDQTKSLNGAVDLGIRFDFNQTGNLNCSEAGCTVTENASTSTTSAQDAKLSGDVTADMTATVTVNGQGAGGCSQTASLPINGEGTISCVVPGVAPIVQEIRAQKQAEADAEAQATGRSVDIPYTLDYEASVQIMAAALVQAEVDKRVGAEQAEQKAAQQEEQASRGCRSNSFVAGTPVLMADGTWKPIQDVEVGDDIDNAVPGQPTVTRHTVTAVHVTDNDRDFVELTIAGPGGTGKIDSTANHLFYDATVSAWTDAAELRPQDRLQTTGDGTVTVQTVRTYGAAVRTYNLTVDGVHTFYVLAGGTPVLVHNSNCFDVHEASESGAKTDPSDKRGLYTMAGRALQKHAGRNGNPNAWPVPSGKQNPAAWNATGQDMLDEILTNPGSVTSNGYGRIGGKWQDTIDMRLPSGLGARFSQAGDFSGFLD